MVLQLKNTVWRSLTSRKPGSPYRERTRISEFARHLMRLPVGLAKGTVQYRFSCIRPFLAFRVTMRKRIYAVKITKLLTQQFDGPVRCKGRGNGGGHSSCGHGTILQVAQSAAAGTVSP